MADQSLGPELHAVPAVELDLPLLRQQLAELGKEVQAAQARVLATVEARHAEFLAASCQVDSLRDAVVGLQTDLRETAHCLRGDSSDYGGMPRSDNADNASGIKLAIFPRRLHQASEEHHALRDEVAALDDSVIVLSTVLEVRQDLDRLEAFTASSQFVEAAELTLKVASALEKISAPDETSEPGILRDAKVLLYRRRTSLVSCLESTLRQLVCIRQGRTEAPQKSSQEAVLLAQVWAGLDQLGLQGRQLEKLSREAQQALLQPLLDAGRQLEPGLRLQPQISSAETGRELWTWAEARVGLGEKRSSKPPVAVVLDALESFCTFACEHWLAGSRKVHAQLGCRVYPWMTRHLLRHFDAYSCDRGETLEQFERKLCSYGFVKVTEKTLSHHVYEYRRALSEDRRVSTLAEVRAWLLTAGEELVSVSDASLPQRLPQDLDKTEGLLQLPKMSVSTVADKLVKRLLALVEESAARIGEGRSEAASDLNKLVRELCSLFCVLRPYSQKCQLKADARSCGLFLTDCLYLAHALLLAPYNHGARLPVEHRQLLLFVDLVPQLRRVGERQFLALLRRQKERMILALQPCNLGRDASEQGTFVASDAALGAAVQQLKTCCTGLAVALPKQMLQETVALLVGCFCQELLRKLLAQVPQTPQPEAPAAEALERLTGSAPGEAFERLAGGGGGGGMSSLWSAFGGHGHHSAEAPSLGASALDRLTGEAQESQEVAGRLSSEDLSSAAALLTSAQALSRQILEAAELVPTSSARPGLQADMPVQVPSWEALILAADLLGSDFSRFLEKRQQILKAFQREETLRLMQLSWYDDALSPEDAAAGKMRLAFVQGPAAALACSYAPGQGWNAKVPGEPFRISALQDNSQ